MHCECDPVEPSAYGSYEDAKIGMDAEKPHLPPLDFSKLYQRSVQKSVQKDIPVVKPKDGFFYNSQNKLEFNTESIERQKDLQVRKQQILAILEGKADPDEEFETQERKV
jgi:hypothetical protein